MKLCQRKRLQCKQQGAKAGTNMLCKNKHSESSLWVPEGIYVVTCRPPQVLMVLNGALINKQHSQVGVLVFTLWSELVWPVNHWCVSVTETWTEEPGRGPECSPVWLQSLHAERDSLEIYKQMKSPSARFWIIPEYAVICEQTLTDHLTVFLKKVLKVIN